MYFLIRYIRETNIDHQRANSIRNLWQKSLLKIEGTCKEFGIKEIDNIGFIYLIITVYNNKRERNSNRVEAKEYWLQLKSLIDELKNYSLPSIVDPNITDKNRFNEIRFHRKTEDPIVITNDKLIFNLIFRILPFLEEQFSKDSYQEILNEITPYVGQKNAQDGYRIYRDKLIFSINDYLAAEESHLNQTQRSRVIKELFDLTEYPITISLRSIQRRIKRDKQAKK